MFPKFFTLLLVFVANFAYSMPFSLSNDDCCCEDSYWGQCHAFYIGPEIYHVHRIREGGTKQNGWIYAAKGGYEHIWPNRFYWAFEAIYGKGTLKGKTASDSHIKSHFTDIDLEGRFGYTFNAWTERNLLLTPFVGGGYALEKSHFVDPTPVPVKFRLHYTYFCAGFLSQVDLLCNFAIGVNFKAKYLYDVRNEVKDRRLGCFTMCVNEEWHYRAEVPLTYHMDCANWYVSLIPFYEFRHYGNRPNFPFDFVDTKFHNYGIFLKFISGW